jgi:hypothetical protein
MGTRLIRTRPPRWRSSPVPSERGVSASRSAMEVTMATLTLTVNGHAHTVDVDPTTPLLYVLSDDLTLRGPKFGCGLGQCGACTVLAQGRALRSCVTPVGTMTGDARAAASAAASVHRRAGSTMRFLFERGDPDRQSVAGSAAASDRGPDPGGAGARLVPVLRAYTHAAGHHTLRPGEGRP